MGLTLGYLTVWAAICALLLVITPTQAQQQQQEQLDQGNTKNVHKPKYSFDVGPLTIDTFVNETEYKEKLRLRKAYLKYVFSSKQMGGNTLPLSTVKLSLMEELVRCENLTLQDPNMLDHIDCLPLENLVNDGSSRGGNKLYTRRTSMRLKIKSMWSRMSEGLKMGYMYDLKDDYVKALIDGELRALNLDSSNMFGASTIENTGFYMEFQNGEIICSGSIVIAHDESKFASPPQPLGLDDVSEYYEVLYRHGAFISLPDFTCRKENDLLGIALSSPITIVWQPEQFPYLTVKHEIITSPLEQFWKYSGSITQQRDESSPLGTGSNPEAYNTTIKIHSRSIFSALSFDLEQTFQHMDKHSGWELMTLIGPYHSLIVNGAWTVDTLAKSLRLLWTNEGEKEDADTWPGIKIDFVDAPSESDIMFSVKMNRKLWAKWMANAEEQQTDSANSVLHEEL